MWHVRGCDSAFLNPAHVYSGEVDPARAQEGKWEACRPERRESKLVSPSWSDSTCWAPLSRFSVCPCRHVTLVSGAETALTHVCQLLAGSGPQPHSGDAIDHRVSCVVQRLHFVSPAPNVLCAFLPLQFVCPFRLLSQNFRLHHQQAYCEGSCVHYFIGSYTIILDLQCSGTASTLLKKRKA